MRLVAAIALLGLPACATVDSREAIDQSLDLVEQQLGERPAWHAPWDEAPPPWDGRSTLEASAAVALALRNNRDLRADLETIGQANAALVQAGLLANPRLNFMIMFPDGGGRSMLRGAGFPAQALQDLWLIPPRQDAAAARLREAVLRVADRAVEIAAEVKQVYARVQYAQRAIELLQTNLEIVEQTRRLVQTQQAAGRATLVQVNVPRIRYLRLRSELLAMQAEYRNAKRELLALMGFADATDEWTVTPVHELDDPLEPPIEEGELLAIAREQRLDLKAAEWSVTAAEHEVRLMQRGAWPDLGVGMTFERAPAPPSQNPSLAGRAANAAAAALQTGEVQNEPIRPFGPTPREVEWTVGPMIDLELPIFDQNQAQIAGAVHMLRQRWAEYDGRRQAITAGVRQASVDWAQAYEQVRFFRESILPEVERNLEVVREQYRAGSEEVTIFLQVEEDLIATRLSALQFMRDLLINRAALERAVGGRLEPAGPGEPDESPPALHPPDQASAADDRR